MPNRMLRDWTDSDKVNKISVHAERFFVRLIMKADDYGCYYSDTRLVKANLFPLLLDVVREADISRWMAECQKAGLIVLYEAEGKKCLQIQDFRQRLDKARAKFPLPPEKKNGTDFPEVVNEFPAEVEVETEAEQEKKYTPIGVGEASASPNNPQVLYKAMGKDKKSLCDFIKNSSPKFIDPYVDLWNLFAQEKGLAKILKVTDHRKKKFKVRAFETAFDFLSILKKAGLSEFLLTGGKWFGFDWIIENESNYLKVLEGNYDKKDGPLAIVPGKTSAPPVKTPVAEIKYLCGRYKEGQLDTKLITDDHFDFLVGRGEIPTGLIKGDGDVSKQKQLRVIEYFEKCIKKEAV